MKKFFFVLLAAGAGYAIWRKVTSADGQRDLWSEVTDPII
ncbi:DLW-39 family protein [Jonesiaceae bacterium BS-20]|uniref:DLW-39 family protein n=1 Tax=Jonesiaceae bacterium BS-20 TaxID=3120821 RepID=A0AAU7DUZ7_9MICO